MNPDFFFVIFLSYTRAWIMNLLCFFLSIFVITKALVMNPECFLAILCHYQGSES